jgi:hypothetical protein
MTSPRLSAAGPSQGANAPSGGSVPRAAGERGGRFYFAPGAIEAARRPTALRRLARYLRRALRRIPALLIRY